MSRKRVRTQNGLRNPLLQFFGAYLRMRRKSMGLTAEYMARSCNVTSTYYRTIESGQNVLGVGSVPELIQVFRSRRVWIDFSSLATLLLAISILGKSLIQQTYSSDALQALDGYSDLKKLVAEMQVFLTVESESAEQQSFLETQAYNAMRDFLEASPGQREVGYTCLKLDDVSPHGVKMLTDLHRELVGRHFMGEAFPN